MCDECEKRPAIAVAFDGFMFYKFDAKGKPVKASAKFKPSQEAAGYKLCPKCLPEFKKRV